MPPLVKRSGPALRPPAVRYLTTTVDRMKAWNWQK